VSEYANIFEFTNFWKFLAEYQEKRDAADPSFMRTEFCNQLGLPLSFLFRWGGAREVSFGATFVSPRIDEGMSENVPAFIPYKQRWNVSLCITALLCL